MSENIVALKKGYENLEVYNRAFSIALNIHKFSLTLPKIEQYAIADQLRRSSMSICANIAEGHAKQHFSKAEFKRYLFIAIGSSQEMKVWISFCKELSYLESSVWVKWDDEYDQISKMLNGLSKSL
jgi:four helix bundle protein